MKVITTTSITAYPLLSRGKVRDIYEIDERTLLIITTDRMSAFDVILNEPVPYKGVVLNQLTLFWMKLFEPILPNHVLEADVKNYPPSLLPWADELEGRSIIARKATPLPIECIVRGYLAGSGWNDYQKTGTLCGYTLPKGLKEAQMLETPLFTPSTKADLGKHDENINLTQASALLGDKTAAEARLLSLNLYAEGSARSKECGIIVADTKFELGYIDGSLHLIDEVLTPDSSRFWPAASYKPGQAQPSLDKQFLRDWLNSQSWDHKPPAPNVPQNILESTAKRYRDIYEILLGKKFPA